MKPIFILILTLLVYGCAKHDNGATFNKEFEKNYEYLDSVINNNTFDTTCISSVKFMEEVTNIKAHPDMTTAGPILFTRADLEAWRDWYTKYKNSLK